MLYPQLAKSAEITSLESFIKDDRWVMEQKLDGNRLLVMSPGADMPPTLITRNGSIYSKKIPAGLRDFRFPEGVGAGEFVLDGELVGDTFYIFDLPICAATNPDTRLSVRRMVLEDTFRFWANGNPALKLVPQAKTAEEKIKLASRALGECFEGLLLKLKDAPYRSGGRTEEWLKVKFVSTADCIVAGVRTDGKDSVDLALIEDGKPRAVGRASLIGKEKGGLVNVGDVLEVRYLYTGAGGRLYQPTILRKRDPNEKAAHECTTDQLKHVNKTVLEAL